MCLSPRPFLWWLPPRCRVRSASSNRLLISFPRPTGGHTNASVDPFLPFCSFRQVAGRPKGFDLVHALTERLFTQTNRSIFSQFEGEIYHHPDGRPPFGPLAPFSISSAGKFAFLGEITGTPSLSLVFPTMKWPFPLKTGRNLR